MATRRSSFALAGLVMLLLRADPGSGQTPAAQRPASTVSFEISIADLVFIPAGYENPGAHELVVINVAGTFRSPIVRQIVIKAAAASVSALDVDLSIKARDPSRFGRNQSIRLAAKFINWPDRGKPELMLNPNSKTVLLQNVSIPEDEYVVSVRYGGFFPDALKAPEQTIRIKSGSAHTIQLRPQTFLKDLAESLWSKDGLIKTLILGMLAAVGAVFRQRLTAALEAIFAFVGRLGVRPIAERRFIKRYLDFLIANHSYIRIIGQHAASVRRPPLEDVYISLRVAHHASLETFSSEHETGETISFGEALSKFNRIAILGGPGTGKTTALIYALLQFARNRERVALGFPRPLLPIYVPLRRVASTRSILEDLGDGDLHILPEEVIQEIPHGFFERRMSQGNCLVLLDGLDEVSDEATHELVANKIGHLTAQYPQNVYIVTCRVAGWRGLLPDFNVLEAADLRREEIHKFVRGWHTAIILGEERARVELQRSTEPVEVRWRQKLVEAQRVIDDRSRRLIDAIDDTPSVLSIATNPMLLSLICLVHMSRYLLPRGRARLYEYCVEFLLHDWQQNRGYVSSGIGWQQQEAVLRSVAMALRLQGQSELTKESLLALLDQCIKDEALSISGPEELLGSLEASGLIVERSIGVFGFSHLTFQEFLVAKQIRDDAKYLPFLISNSGKQGFREVLLLYAGLVGDGTSVTAAAFGDKAPEQIILAAHCLGEAQRVDTELEAKIVTALEALIDAPSDRVDAIAAAAASVAADFKGDPTRPTQKLASKLIANLQTAGAAQALAINILGRARIKAALPSLCDLLWVAGPEPREPLIRAITSFGNIGLEQLIASFKHNMGVHPVTRQLVRAHIQILHGVNTTEAARALVHVYELVPNARSLISLAISSLLKNPLIERDLRIGGMCPKPPAILGHGSREKGWDTIEATEAEEFRILDSVIRADLVCILKGDYAYNTIEDIRSMGPSIKQSFPAILEACRDSTKSPPEDMLAAMGYVISKEEGPSLSTLWDSVKRTSEDLFTTIERARGRSSREDGITPDRWPSRALDGLCSLVLALYPLWSALLTATMLFQGTTDPKLRSEFLETPWLFWKLLLDGSMFIILLIYSVSKHWRWPWSRMFLAPFFGVHAALRSAPLLLRFAPRASAALLLGFISVFSAPVTLGAVAFFIWEADTWEIIGFCSLPFSLFWAAAARYYRRRVVRRTAAVILLERHGHFQLTFSSAM
jgi:NACHT domain